MLPLYLYKNKKRNDIFFGGQVAMNFLNIAKKKITIIFLILVI